MGIGGMANRKECRTDRMAPAELCIYVPIDL